MAGIGATLREAREGAHLDIMDFEVRTKIRAKYLRALEDEEWSLLPGYTFTKGFLRTYADMLGLDGRALVDEFKRQYRDPSEIEAPPLTPAGRRDPRRARERQREQGGERGGRAGRPRRPPRPPIVVGVIVLIVLLVAALYALGVLLPRSNKPTTTNTRTNTTRTRTTHTTTTRNTAPHRTHTPARVGLQLVPKTRVYICLVGFPGASSAHRDVRRNAVVIAPGDREPIFHDNHFKITVGNGQITLVVDGHRHPLAGPNPLSYKVTLHGRLVPLKASQVPHCG